MTQVQMIAPGSWAHAKAYNPAPDFAGVTDARSFAQHLIDAETYAGLVEDCEKSMRPEFVDQMIAKVALVYYTLAVKNHGDNFGAMTDAEMDLILRVATECLKYTKELIGDEPCGMWSSPYDFTTTNPVVFVVEHAVFALETDAETIDVTSEDFDLDGMVRVMTWARAHDYGYTPSEFFSSVLKVEEEYLEEGETMPVIPAEILAVLKPEGEQVAAE